MYLIIQIHILTDFPKKIHVFADKWDESLKIVDFEKDELSYCIDTKSKSYGRFRSPNGLVN